MHCFHQGADSGIAAYRLRGRVRHAEAGFLFQRTQFIKKRVIFGVCQRRRVEIVVFIPAAVQPVGQFPYSLLLLCSISYTSLSLENAPKFSS